MSFSSLKNVKISAVYTDVPKKEISIEDELEYYGGSLKRAKRMQKIIGVHKRRVGYPDITASDLCFSAAERLFEEQDIDKNDIDTLIFVSQHPDYQLPATACVLQHRLKLSTACACFDVNQGCAGYVYGLWLASSLISAGGAKKILLLAGDSNTAPLPASNRVISPIFGDGGSATLLEFDCTAAPISFSIGTDGSGYDAIIAPGGASRIPYASDFEGNEDFFKDIQAEDGTPWRLNSIYMDGQAVFDFSLNVVPAHLQKFMEQNQITPDDVDWLFLHQANKQIVENISGKTGFSIEKAPVDAFCKYGNLYSASIPSIISETLGEVEEVRQQKILLCGFGVGLTWASCLFQADGLKCSPVADYGIPDDALSRDELIDYWKKRFQNKDK